MDIRVERSAAPTVSPSRPVSLVSDAQPDVQLDSVTKRFGDFLAVDDLSLAINRGEFFSLLGPSGCGKTTTLRMIGGFEQPSVGEIYLAGQPVTNVPPHRRDVNTVFQSYALFPHLTVYDNLAFGLRQRHVSKREIEQRVNDALTLVDLAGLGKRKPAQFSGGQQQRVALARALINRPKVLLLDEPLGALDARLRKHMQLELKRIQMEVGITFIYVTHDQEEALTMSDRIGVMRAGKIEQIGVPQEVYDRPATGFVARFLGASNLLEGVVVAREPETMRIRLASGDMLTTPVGGFPAGEERVSVGVRPEKIVLEPVSLTPVDAEPRSGWNSVSGRVQLATFIGVSYQYTIEGPGGTTLTVMTQNAGTAWAPSPGEPVRLLWRPENTFVVEPSAGMEEEI